LLPHDAHLGKKAIARICAGSVPNVFWRRPWLNERINRHAISQIKHYHFFARLARNYNFSMLTIHMISNPRAAPTEENIIDSMSAGAH
jgi:hypothetical protein